jgi:hypothetical protein
MAPKGFPAGPKPKRGFKTVQILPKRSLLDTIAAISIAPQRPPFQHTLDTQIDTMPPLGKQIRIYTFNPSPPAKLTDLPPPSHRASNRAQRVSRSANTYLHVINDLHVVNYLHGGFFFVQWK